MKLVFYSNGSVRPGENKKHLINFFGIFGCIKVNVFAKDASEKQENELNVVKHYFDYPYFSQIVNPEHFQEELKGGEKKLTRVMWLCCFILSTASLVLSYLAYSNQKSKKVIAGLIIASVLLSIIALVLFGASLLWMIFYYIKEKFIVHRFESFLKNELSPEKIKHCKKEFIGENSEIDVEVCDQELEKNKDIDDIIEFLLKRSKFAALRKFLANGEQLIQAGMAMVNMLLLKGIHPNDIVLDTNSLGGGIAAEVLKRFEEQDIHLTLIHSNSYGSFKDVVRDSPYSLFKWLPSRLLNNWFWYCGLDFNPREIIKNTKCPVLIAGRKGDDVIPEELQLVNKLEDRDPDTGQFRRNIVLEHDPNIKNCSVQRIHVDCIEHLVYQKDGTKYPEVKNIFIGEGDQYLEEHKLNGDYKLEKYKESPCSKSLTNKAEFTEISVQQSGKIR